MPPEEDADKWAANWVSNISAIAGASGDVDEFARGLSEYWGEGEITDAQEYRDAVEGTDREEKVNEFLDRYEQDSTTPSETEIKRAAVVSLTNTSSSDADDLSGDELDNALSNALDAGGQKWINNTRNALGF